MKVLIAPDKFAGTLTAVEAARAIAEDFQPLSDMRASAEYRATVARNLIRRFWLEQSEPGLPVRLRQSEGV